MDSSYIGNTPMVKINGCKDNNVYVKLEGKNLFGSAKDRAAIYVLNKLLENKLIDNETEIVESSSGNMAVALAGVCGRLKLKLTVFIDSSIMPINEYLIKSMGAKIIKITEADENNSYLKNRIKNLREYLKTKDNVYWFNQYANELVPEAYKNTLGKEILENMPNVDYVFVGISSGGSICGISNALKDYSPNIRCIAVDIKGSKLFEPDTKEKKTINGIGSSIQSDNFKRACFDDYIVVEEKLAYVELKKLLSEEMLFVGGTSGCVLTGAKQYILKHNIKGKNVICVFHDSGDRYYDALFDINE